jgi:hypothetical protein
VPHQLALVFLSVPVPDLYLIFQPSANSENSGPQDRRYRHTFLHSSLRGCTVLQRCTSLQRSTSLRHGFHVGRGAFDEAAFYRAAFDKAAPVLFADIGAAFNEAAPMPFGAVAF